MTFPGTGMSFIDFLAYLLAQDLAVSDFDELKAGCRVALPHFCTEIAGADSFIRAL